MVLWFVALGLRPLRTRRFARAISTLASARKPRQGFCVPASLLCPHRCKIACSSFRICVSFKRRSCLPSPTNTSEVLRMKHCPACNFSFPNFHRVCDFDGTELVPDPERPPLVNAGPRPSRGWRILKSPVFWASLLLTAVLSSSFLVAYWEATGQSTPVVRTQSPSASREIPTVVGQAPPQSSVVSEESGSATNKSRNVDRLAARAQRLHRTSNARAPQRLEVARRKDSPEISTEKGPKLVAMLRTTWRVLKKPFRF